jgi:hypothetical protein
MVNQNDLKDRLFEIEPLSPERQKRFRNELAQIIDPRLPRSHRIYYIGGLVCILIGLPGAVCGLLFDVEHRWIWGLNLVTLIVFAAWILFILRRGSEPLSMMQGLSKGLSGIACIVAVLSIVIDIQTPSLSSILWAMLGLLFFVLMSFINLWNRVMASERTIREHILRVEYRLANSDSTK